MRPLLGLSVSHSPEMRRCDVLVVGVGTAEVGVAASGPNSVVTGDGLLATSLPVVLIDGHPMEEMRLERRE